MPRKPTLTQIKTKANQLIDCSTVEQVEQLLKINRFAIAQNILFPQYFYFTIPKPKGGVRQIEAPASPLKNIQRKLNERLQCVYFNIQSPAAYGFIINTTKQHRNNQTKNIITNAQKHLGNSYLLNIDLDNFFHQISQKTVISIYTGHPFYFPKKLASTLAKLCTNKQRLPMGAPTSPVLSNFACLNLDKELIKWAKAQHITYTRFVDDLSFSSQKPITQHHISDIKQILANHNFKIDPAKTKLYKPHQDKIVTGLVLKDQIELPEQYLIELNKDIDRLQKVTEVQIITGNIDKPLASKKFKQQIMGKINFIATVKGYDSPVYNTYLQQFETALNPPDKELLSQRWIHFNNYHSF